jgi:hypothetical protein
VLAMLVSPAEAGEPAPGYAPAGAIALRRCPALRAVAFGWCRGQERPDKSTRARRAASNKELHFGMPGRRRFIWRRCCTAILTYQGPST